MERFPLPPALVEQARAYAAGEDAPAEPRNAATVVLLRDTPVDTGTGGHELYLMRRQQSMAFAGGMWVFPGGGVDDADSDATISWAGPRPAEWATRLGVDEDLARALVCAAVRETFEESGVLLAGPDADSVVADTTGEDWEADRHALEARELHFTEFLRRRGLVLRTDLLGAWSGWLTPIFEPRRYRTWFFVAVLPPGQVTRDVSTESSAVEWRTPLSAVAEAEAGRVMLMPPTYLTCLDVARFADPDAVLTEAASRRIEMFMPEVVPAPDGSDEFILSTPPQYLDLLAAHQAGEDITEVPAR